MHDHGSDANSRCKARLGLHTSQTTRVANDHGRYGRIVKGKSASFVKNILFHWNVNLVVKVLLKCVICFSTDFFWYTVPNFRTKVSRPLVYSVCISSKAAATPAVLTCKCPWKPWRRSPLPVAPASRTGPAVHREIMAVEIKDTSSLGCTRHQNNEKSTE